MYICSKISRVIGIINRKRHIFPFRVKKMLYYSMIYSHVNYCLLVYGTAPTSNFKNLITLQKRYIRALFNVPPLTHSDNLFSLAKIIPMQNIFEFKLIMTFLDKSKTAQKHYITALSELTRKIYRRDTRVENHVTYNIPAIRKMYMRSSLKFCVPFYLNKYDLNTLKRKDLITLLLN